MEWNVQVVVLVAVLGAGPCAAFLHDLLVQPLQHAVQLQQQQQPQPVHYRRAVQAVPDTPQPAQSLYGNAGAGRQPK